MEVNSRKGYRGLDRLSPWSLLVPYVVFAFLVLGLLVYLEYVNLESRFRQNGKSILEKGAFTLQTRLQDLQLDCLMLAGARPLEDYLIDPRPEYLESLTDQWGRFSKIRGIYDQIRYLDETGQELVRVDLRNDVPLVVGKQGLQNKGSRYYFKAAINLLPGTVYVSPLDLNVEGNKVEVPHKPVMRFATPVHDAAGASRGIVVLNYRGKEILGRLADIEGESGLPMDLLNRQGFWLKSHDPAREWGFMLGSSQTYQDLFPEVWKKMVTEESGQVMNGGELVFFLRIQTSSGQVQPAASAKDYWILECHQGLFAPEQWEEPLGRLGVVAAILVLIGGFFLLMQYRTWLSLKISEADLKQKNQQLEVTGRLQNTYLQNTDHHVLYSQLLKDLLSLDGSLYGMIGEVVRGEGQGPELRIWAFSDLAWNEASRKLYQEVLADGQTFRSLNNLFGRVVLDQEVILANDAPTDPRSHGLPPGHPPIKNFLGIPVIFGGDLVGMIGLANHPRGYSKKSLEVLQPVLDVLGQIIFLLKVNDAKIQAERDLITAKNQAMEANRAKSLFLASMSHEIRTPMNAILGLTYLALEGNLPPKERDLLLKVHSSSKLLMGVLNDILDFSKIEAGRLEIQPEAQSLSSIVHGVVSLFRDQAEQKGLDFRISIPDDFFPAVVVDGLRLSQILMNLLSNAIKFTPQGFVALSAEVEPGLATIVRCRFQVSDSGIGMSLEQQQNLFKPFSQGDSAITRKYGGTGLGLVISSRLAELMGGHLEVVSELGRGSIFSLDLELSLAKAADVVPTGPAGSFRDEAPLSGLKILLVEDNAINLQIARELLQSRGASVVTASSGQSALAQAPDQDFDVVLMDLYMPDMDGYQTAAALRQLPGWGGIPIVALSASVLSEDREKALKSGLRAFLPKPLDPELTVTTLINLTRKGMRHDET